MKAYRTPKDAVGLKSEIFDEIQNDAVDDYENEKYGYQDEDESDKENRPKNDECPCCFAKISPEDKECPNCGYKLK